jgi:predicted nucleic acid-binding protein
MTVRILADTNILIYAIDNRDRAKQARCQAWLKAITGTNSLTISPQVLNEAHNVLRRKFALPGESAERLLAPWVQFCRAPLRLEETLSALAIERRWKTAWWDALLIASAAADACTHLLTEDTQSSPLIEGVRIIDPFRVAPEELLRSA